MSHARVIPPSAGLLARRRSGPGASPVRLPRLYERASRSLARYHLENPRANEAQGRSYPTAGARTGEPVEEAREAEQVRLAQAGDREAFARLVDRYWGRVQRWL